MLIGKVSELTGATRKAIRHYESIGLIPPAVRQGTYRIYCEHDVMVIGMIVKAKTLGFSLVEIKNIVSKKTKDQKLPIEMVCQLIDQKRALVIKQAEELLENEKKLAAFKMDFVEKFS